MKRYVAELTSEGRNELVELVSKGKAAARKITHARVLLQADESKTALAGRIIRFQKLLVFTTYRAMFQRKIFWRYSRQLRTAIRIKRE